MSEWELPKNVESVSIEKSGGFLWDTGVYDVTVKLAYLDQAESKAVSLNIILANAEGKELKESMFIKSGDAKGNKTYYEKDGKIYPLPGYSTANSLCIAATGKNLAQCMTTLEQKQIKVYDSKTKTDALKPRPVLVDLIGKPVKVAVNRVKENKQQKNSQGVYVNTADTREINECKFFANTQGFSAEEIEAKATVPEAVEKWKKLNEGKVIDKSSKTVGTSAASIMGGTTPPAGNATSLFGN